VENLQEHQAHDSVARSFFIFQTFFHFNARKPALYKIASLKRQGLKIERKNKEESP
jgi:hypothetical protein